MRALRSASTALALSLASVATAADFDGTVPLTCTAQKGHDCLPTAAQCSPLKPQTNIAPVLDIDFANKQVRSPFRTALLPVLNTSTNKDSLVLQGADLLLAWSALIDKKTGALTVSVADSKGAYVVFGQCKVGERKTK
jgi:hypothetical protein